MPTPEEQLTILMSIVGFDQAELSANRQGYLSERQEMRARSDAFTPLAVFAICGIALGVGIVLASKQPVSVADLTIGVLLGGTLVAVGLGLFILGWRDYQRKVVKCASGFVTVRPAKMGFALVVGEEQLPLLYDLRGLFDADRTYRAYYLPSNRRLLSIEPSH